MGTPLLENVSKPKQTHHINREQLKCIIDKILVRAVQDKTSVSLVMTRFNYQSLKQNDKYQNDTWIEKALKGLIAETTPKEWYYVQDHPFGYLSLIAGKTKNEIIQTIHHLHETWRILIDSCGHDPSRYFKLTWGIAAFPEDACDRISLLRATEIAWYQTQRDQNGPIGRFQFQDAKEVRCLIHATQWDRLKSMSERDGIEMDELIQEAIDEYLAQSQYPIQY